MELSSGAVRNHNLDIMVKAFEIAGYDEEVLKQKFGALYNAFQFGAPPHAGTAQDLMCGAPNEVTEQQLREVHIKVRQ